MIEPDQDARWSERAHRDPARGRATARSRSAIVQPSLRQQANEAVQPVEHRVGQAIDLELRRVAGIDRRIRLRPTIVTAPAGLTNQVAISASSSA